MANLPLLSGKSRLGISTRGVEDIQIYQLSNTTGTTDTPASLGYVKSVEFKQEGSIVEIIDGLGDVVNAVASGKKVTIMATILQTSKEMIDVIANTDDLYHAVYIRAKTANGGFQEVYIPLARIKPSASINYSNSERTISVEITALLGKHSSSQSIATVGVVETVSIPSGDYFVIKEVAPVLGVYTPQGTFATGTNDELYTNFV